MPDMPHTKTGPDARTAPPAASTGDHRIASTELLGARGRIDIEHRGQLYRLIETRQGKLILTK